VRDPQRYLRALAHHRVQREAAILQRLSEGDETIPQMVAHIYEDVDARLHGAATLTVFAHIEDLIARGLVKAAGAANIGAATIYARYVRT
jgi:sulfur transfer complex TusBCD TusB component (DsrH family)